MEVIDDFECAGSLRIQVSGRKPSPSEKLVSPFTGISFLPTITIQQCDVVNSVRVDDHEILDQSWVGTFACGLMTELYG